MGNGTTFGNLTVSHYYGGGTSSPTRGVFGGGYTGGNSATDVIDYVQIMSTGDAVDFGNLSATRTEIGAFSNGNGGLG